MTRRIRLTGWNRTGLEDASMSEGPTRQYLRHQLRGQMHLDCFWKMLSKVSRRYTGVVNSSRQSPEEEEVAGGFLLLSPKFDHDLLERYKRQRYLTHSDIVAVNRRYQELDGDYRTSLYCQSEPFTN